MLAGAAPTAGEIPQAQVFAGTYRAANGPAVVLGMVTSGEGPAPARTVFYVPKGYAIDLAKAISAATGLPVVSVPTTYSGSEWTTFFGIRDPGRRMKGGGAGARLAGIVYEPELFLDLPRDQSGGTALGTTCSRCRWLAASAAASASAASSAS